LNSKRAGLGENQKWHRQVPAMMFKDLKPLHKKGLNILSNKFSKDDPFPSM
jgi:hypothetical protein